MTKIKTQRKRCVDNVREDMEHVGLRKENVKGRPYLLEKKSTENPT